MKILDSPVERTGKPNTIRSDLGFGVVSMVISGYTTHGPGDVALRIGQRAALVPTPGAEVYGLVFSPTRSELDRLYSESSVQAYKPQAVLSGAPGDI